MIEKKLGTNTLKIVRHNKLGYPCLWKSSRSYKKLTVCTSIYDENIIPKDPIYSNYKDDSFLIQVKEGDIVLKIFLDYGGVSISILRILEIYENSEKAKSEIILRRESLDDEWILNIDAKNIDNNHFEDLMVYSDNILEKFDIYPTNI